MKVARIWLGRFAALGAVITMLGMAPRPSHVVTFPHGFLWGAATAAQQVEGGNTLNDWYQWELEGHTADLAGWADDEYHRYPEDFDLARSLGHNATRFSIEWSRIEPKQGVFDDSEVEHYRQVLLAAHARGLKTFLTLQHFTLPEWVAQQGSWLGPKTPQYFAEFVAYIVPKLGDLVDYWLTLNEPNVNTLTAYLVGATPPGLHDVKNVGPVLSNFMKAHAAAYHIIHAMYPDAKVGFAHHMRAFQGEHWWNPLDAIIASWLDDLWNIQILKAMTTGRIYFHVPFLLSYDEEYPELAHTLDFIGVNYYTRDRIAFDLSSPQYFDKMDSDVPEQWDYYPQGMYDSLMRAASFGVPVYVTENGIADSTDARRKQYLCDHLKEVGHAIEDGADVRGYIHWALIDNWEWVYGFEPRFGLIQVDYSTQERHVRPSAEFFKQIIQSDSLQGCN